MIEDMPYPGTIIPQERYRDGERIPEHSICGNSVKFQGVDKTIGLYLKQAANPHLYDPSTFIHLADNKVLLQDAPASFYVRVLVGDAQFG